jgi:hypothetical protein
MSLAGTKTVSEPAEEVTGFYAATTFVSIDFFNCPSSPDPLGFAAAESASQPEGQRTDLGAAGRVHIEQIKAGTAGRADAGGTDVGRANVG